MKIGNYRKYLVLAIASVLLLGCTGPTPKHGANLIPPKGKTLYLAHQHTFQDDLENLFRKNAAGSAPAGLVINTSLYLKLSTKILGSFELASLQPLFDQHSHLVPVFLLSIDRTQFAPLCTGDFDDNINKLSGFLKGLKRPVYLSPGVEVNNPMYRNEPEDYVAAYRCLVDKLSDQSVQNVAYIWYLNSMLPNYQNRDVMAWYPGDGYVNWMGTNLYKLLENHYVEKAVFKGPNYEQLLSIARQKDLPLMIVESSALSVKKNFQVSGQALWDAWYQPFFDFVYEHEEIQAFSHLSHNLGDPLIRQKWLEQMENKRFVYGDTNLYRVLQ